jgi:hypothetical protein
MKKKEKEKKAEETTKKSYTFTNVADLIKTTNGQIEDTLYIADDIFIPKKKNIGRCYRSDFTFETKEQAEKLVQEKKAVFYHKDKESDFFVYNERAGELLPFKKNDYRIFDHGYLTFDGTSYIEYDDNGIERKKFSYIDDTELNVEDIDFGKDASKKKK